MNDTKTYIGDGVWVAMDGVDIIAYTDISPEGKELQEYHQTICFKPEVLEALNRFYQRMIADEQTKDL